LTTVVDYDRTNIPEGYDRGRDHGPEALALWMSEIESRVRGRSIRRILDLGCGTGRFSQALAEIRGVFESVGLRHVSSELITQPIAPTWEAYADKLASGADSVLARVSDAELEAGLERVRQHAAAVDPQAVTEPIDLLTFEVPAN
jgi:SAM-dependent methyltransferase